MANFGAASRHSALAVRGGPESLDDAAKTKQQKPAWDNVIVVESAAGVGLNLKADFANAAILPVQPKATTYRVKFTKPEADGDYAVFVDQSWVAGRSITQKTADGFVITFSAPAPETATLDWMIVR